MKVTSCVEETRILFNLFVILQSFSLLFQNVRVLPKTLKSNEWVAWWQEQEDGMKFQQHNSSSKNGEENE
jgi:hypothetical protein